MKTEDCDVCGGESQIEDTNPYDHDEYVVMKCAACDGTGEQAKRQRVMCSECGNTEFSDGLTRYCMKCGKDAEPDELPAL
jgi:hypothetical protein